jgi:hypothetical protein
MLYYTILHYTILYCTYNILYCTIIYYTTLYYTVLHYTYTIQYYTVLYYTIKGKGKAFPLQAWSGPEVSRKLKFPDFMTTAQDGGKIVSLTHRPP